MKKIIFILLSTFLSLTIISCSKKDSSSSSDDTTGSSNNCTIDTSITSGTNNMSDISVRSLSGTSSLRENASFVSKDSISQYQVDNYLLFDPFNDNGTYTSNTSKIPIGRDFADLTTRPVTLGNKFTIETLIYSDQRGGQANYYQRIIGGGPSLGKLGNPPHYDGKQSGPYIYTTGYGSGLMYGFGTGTLNLSEKVDNITASQKWYHVATTFDGNTFKLFVDGLEVKSSTRFEGETPVQAPVEYLGADFLGKMDEVRIWKVARTQSEIQSTMSQNLTGTETGLVAYYPMDLTEDYKLTDLSLNQNHAILKGAEIVPKFFSDSCNKPDGSLNCPYPTISNAFEDARPGDHIYIRKGRYSEVLKKWDGDTAFKTKDNSTALIIFEAYPNEEVIIDGSVPVNAKWETYNHNGHCIYKAILDFNSISKEAKAPVDSNYQNSLCSVEFGLSTAHELDTTCANINKRDIWHLWVNGRHMMPAYPINAKNPVDGTIGNPSNPEPGSIFSEVFPVAYGRRDDNNSLGALKDLDHPEEWAFDPSNSTLYYYPTSNYIPNSTNVRIRVKDRFLLSWNQDKLVFRKIHFFGGSLGFQSSDNITFEDCKFSFSKMYTSFASNHTIRNCVFEHVAGLRYRGISLGLGGGDRPGLLLDNVLFRNINRHKSGGGTFSEGPNNVWRYVTKENDVGGGGWPGYRSLVEYIRFENLHANCDCSGIQRNSSNTFFSTTRYSWIINAPHLNGVRFDSKCGGQNGDIHHVVSLGNHRGFRIKGDYHDLYHLTAYNNATLDVSVPSYKYCGLDRLGPQQLGNRNSNLKNSIAENSCQNCENVPADNDSTDKNSIDNASHYYSRGIWWGRMLSPLGFEPGKNWTTPYVLPRVFHAVTPKELENPWLRNRAWSKEKRIAKYGVDPFKNEIQNYDFRPRKGSDLIDTGVVVEGINDGQDKDLNHLPLYPGQNRKFVGNAPDVGAYEYGDLVYWIPGFRYPYPSVPIPNNKALDIPMEYSLVWNYPYKINYDNVTATVTVNGPGVNRTETFNYPNNVHFQTFEPGGTYNWSVKVDNISGGNWSFSVEDRIYPLNDRSVDITDNQILIHYQINTLEVSKNNIAFLRFDIPTSITNSHTIKLNLVPQNVVSLTGGIAVHKYDRLGWGEKMDNNNIGTIDHTLGTQVATLSSLVADTAISLDLSSVINSTGEQSLALRAIEPTDNVSFYSREKLYCCDYKNSYTVDYAPQKDVWPSISFQ